jgi:putative FmdB family regulatory protein
MPIYEYRHTGECGEGCTEYFEVEQAMRDERFAACPRCGNPVERLIFPVGFSSPQGNAELKNLGFTKLVRRDDGVYENVTATSKESRYMKRGDSSTLPDFKGKITD